MYTLGYWQPKCTHLVIGSVEGSEAGVFPDDSLHHVLGLLCTYHNGVDMVLETQVSHDGLWALNHVHQVTTETILPEMWQDNIFDVSCTETLLVFSCIRLVGKCKILSSE